jgi:hypothetical protein
MDKGNKEHLDRNDIIIYYSTVVGDAGPIKKSSPARNPNSL